MSITKHHAEWLSLIDISGPFLSLTSLSRVFPQGLDALETSRIQELRAAYEEWQAEAPGDPRFHQAWVRYVLDTLLGWDAAHLAEGQSIPPEYKYTPEYGETIRPTYMLHQKGQPRALISIYPFGTPIEKPMAHAMWTASPATRMLSLLGATNVTLGLVTNGEQWMLIKAPTGQSLAGYASWYSELWVEERLTLRAFVSLLEARRFFGVADEDTLEAMLAESANDSQEVTDLLGLQVRHAVEILVRSLDRADQDSDGRLLEGIEPDEVYQAVLTVMMRLVFLLSAEERGLFLLGDPLYDQSYAVSTLRAQLRETADQMGEDVLERRGDAWSRLLATFRLVYHGAVHEDLRLPAYGGSLFDPDRFPFLEGRVAGLDGTPPNVDNRTVLHLLDALQVLYHKGEFRRLSFRALDIEQIGHVYEGLLDHEARRAEEVMLGFTGGDEPEIALSTLMEMDEADVHNYLKEMTGRSSVSPIRNALSRPYDGERARRLHTICRDETVYEAALPYLNLLRDDEFGYPIVILPGSLYVTAGTERRASGTHYTPRSLTEPIVTHTLDPILYRGMADGLPAQEWELLSPREILSLKVCDMAMGSGAFLVQACRYLAEHLQIAWDKSLEAAGDPIPRLTVEGETPTGALTEILIPDDPSERNTLALRLIADRCLYGVDKNPLAVEMAKLSLWLTTLAKGRPFTFLDHALKCGDSLVGVSLEQLRYWKLKPDPKKDGEQFIWRLLKPIIEHAVELRQQLETFTVNTVSDQQEKARLYEESEQVMAVLKIAADHLIAETMRLSTGGILAELANLMGELRDAPNVITAIQNHPLPPANELGALRPFHWELEFPEVFLREAGGFEAFMGNPPFVGGLRIRRTLGDIYRDSLFALYPDSGGNSDLSAFFFLRSFEYLNQRGNLGLIATNTIAQGDTGETGLDKIVNTGGIIYWAIDNHPWPGQATVTVSIVHIAKTFQGPRYLNSSIVEYISSSLDSGLLAREPNVLSSNRRRGFIGTYPNGSGFILAAEEVNELIQRDARNRKVLFPYLVGQDVVSNPDQSATRWIINFFDWSLETAEQYPDCLAIVRERVYPERANNRDRQRREVWWRFSRPTLEMYRAIEGQQYVLVCCAIAKYLAFVYVPNQQVYDQRLCVFSLDQDQTFAALQSTIHELWARARSSTLETRLSYSITSAFDTFPFPIFSPSLDDIGVQYHKHRSKIMRSRHEGLTDIYNRFHNPDEHSDDIAHLRDLHVQMDSAVAAAYGWDDLALDHDFHETDQGIRYTISEAARREVLRRLLALNFERHAEEERLKALDQSDMVSGKKGKRQQSAAEPEPLFDPDDPNAPPFEQTSFLPDDKPKQRRLL